MTHTPLHPPPLTGTKTGPHQTKSSQEAGTREEVLLHPTQQVLSDTCTGVTHSSHAQARAHTHTRIKPLCAHGRSCAGDSVSQVVLKMLPWQQFSVKLLLGGSDVHSLRPHPPAFSARARACKCPTTDPNVFFLVGFPLFGPADRSRRSATDVPAVGPELNTGLKERACMSACVRACGQIVSI